MAPVKNPPDFASAQQPSTLAVRGLTGHVGSSQSLALLSLEKRAKVGLMGHNKGRDNAKKRAKRRKKHERLASVKQPSRDATARQAKEAGK